MKYLNKFSLVSDSIKIPIKVGDTVLGGRFKNKKMIVKKIGKNAKGDITINDKPLLKFRIIKESLREDIEINLLHLIDEGFKINFEGDERYFFIRIWLPVEKSNSEYSYSNTNDFNWQDVESDLVRALNHLVENYKIYYLYTIASKDQDGLGFKRTEWNVNYLLENGTFGTNNPGRIKSIMISVEA